MLKKYNPEQTILDLTARFIKIRIKLKLTQSDIAFRSGVSFGTVKRFEQTGQISLESLIKLSHFLNRLSDFEAVFIDTELFNSTEKNTIT